MHDDRTARYTRSLYDVLGVPLGASIDHIRDSYRLLSNKTLATDAAYQTLTDPEKRGKYDASLRRYARQTTQIERTKDGQSWGNRGRERCSCGRILEIDDEWLCQECWERQVYFVVFDMSGVRIVHQDEFLWPTAGSEEKALDPVAFGPFTEEEAEQFLSEKSKLRDRGSV
jgi:curved DNA-binding protein CbpA